MKSEIVFFTHTLEGGVGRVIMLLAEGFLNENVSSEVWVQENTNLSSSITPVKIFSFNKKKARQLFFVLLKKINEDKPRVIISSTFYTNIIAIAASLFSRHKVKVIVIEHIAVKSEFKNLSLLKKLTMRILVFLFYRLAHSVVTVSNESGDILSKYCLLPRKKIITIYNPVISKDLYEKSDTLIDHPFFNLGHPILLNVGRLDKQKDIGTLLNAFSIITKEIESRLIIIGTGNEKAQLIEQCKKLKIFNQVDFIGHLKNPYPFFKKSSVFVLSSLYEGLPTVIIEAIALRLPVVSTRCPSGPAEILKQGEFGILVPIKDPKSLAQGVLNLLKNKNIIQEAPEAYLDIYTQKYSADRYLSLIKNIEKKND